ncbi:MAG TPA: hypothetical protein VIY48_18270, partial [Candidatus Paceibacterota bacterium]
MNGANVVNVKVWYQNLPDIQPNTNYEFSAWIASLQTNNPAILQFSINGQLLGEPFHVYDSHCFWYQFYAIWNSGSNTEANISLVNQDTLISGNDFALDDISFATAIAYYDTVYVEVLPQYDSRFHRQASSCINDVTEVNYIGNAPDTANFHWNFGDAVVFSGSGPGPYEITYLTPGVHTITLWVDGYGCPSNTTTHTIAVMERPVATAYADDPVLIYGSYTTLHGSYSGGSGPFTYSWSHPELLVNPGALNPQTVSMVSSASFILTVTDEQGNCSGYDTAVVQIVDGPLGVNLFSNPGEICPGEPSVLTAQGIGGAKSYSYSWVSDPPGFTSNLKTVTVEPTTTTIYTVTVNDGLNSFSGSITVTVEAPPVANAGLDVDIPYGTFAQLQGSASGGGGSYAYHWEPDSLVTNPDSASTQTVNLTSSTVFTLQLTDLVTGCTSQPDEVLVTMIGGPLSVVIHTDRPAICKGDTAILTAYASGGNL